MSNNGVKLAYVSSSYRVRCEFTKAACRNDPIPPDDVFERAKKKLESVKKEGSIELYTIYESRLTRTWSNLRKSKAPDDKTMEVLLGVGCPPMMGIDLRRSSVSGEIALLSIQTTMETAIHWDIHMLEVRINHMLEKLGVRTSVDQARLHRILLHAQSGRPIERVPIHSAPMHFDLEERKQKPYVLHSDTKNRDLILHVHDLKPCVSADGWKKLYGEIQAAAEIIEKKGDDEVDVLKDDLVRTLKLAKRGPQAFGLELPLSLLVGVEQDLAPKSLGMAWRDRKYKDLKRKLKYPVGGQKKRRGVERKPALPGAIEFEFKVADDQMSVTVVSVELGKNTIKDLTPELVKSELEAIGVKFGHQVSHYRELHHRMKAMQDPKDLVVAEGNDLQHGSEPFLAAVFREAAKSGSFRDQQQKNIVKKGDKIAEIQYKTPPIDKVNVFGEIEKATFPDPPEIDVGKGAEAKDDGYYALIDGVPVVDSEANKLKVVSGYVHEGDVNLATGNIIMKGDVEIGGSVQMGSRVEVDGNLLIRGSISEAYVSCTGDLEVELGVISGTTGCVKCGGNMKAEFIENAVVYVQGRLKVEKAILSSLVFVEGTIKVASESGIISGGTVSSPKRITANSIGRDGGTITELYAGTDWRWYRAIEIPERRIDALTETRRQWKNDLRTYSKAKPGSVEAGKVGKLEDDIKRITDFIARMQERLEERKERKPNHVTTASVRCNGPMSSNIRISIGGQIINLSDTTEGVAIIFKKKTGPRIVPLDEAKSHTDSEDEAA